MSDTATETVEEYDPYAWVADVARANMIVGDEADEILLFRACWIAAQNIYEAEIEKDSDDIDRTAVFLDLLDSVGYEIVRKEPTE